MAVSICLLFSACKDNSSDPAQKVVVGLIAGSGGFGDNGFNADAKQGLLTFSDRDNITLAFLDYDSTTSSEKKLDYMIQKKANLIFCNGYEYVDVVKTYALLYPNIAFSLADCDEAGLSKNIINYYFDINKACTQVGYLAAYFASKNDMLEPSVSFIGGMDCPQINAFLTGYSQGINLYNERYSSNVTIKIAYINSYTDSIKGYSVAQAHIDAGADVVFPPAGNSGKGALQAAVDGGVPAIGYDNDCYYSIDFAKKILISSCMKKLNNAVVDVTNKYLASLNGSTISAPIKYIAEIAPYHDYESKIPANIKSEVLQIEK